MESGVGTHLSAQEIWLRARARAPRIGFATVHRGLIRLHELGAIMKIFVPGEAGAVYEPAVAPHAHLRCYACGAISDLAYVVPVATVHALRDEHHVAIDGESVTFSGRCAACATPAP